MMTLPLFVTRRNKYLTGALMYGLSYYLYYIINHNPLYEPKMLPLTWIDENAPFMPWTVLIYVSEYIFFAVAYILYSNYNNINKYLYSYFMLQLVSCMIFVMYPTILPRDNFPIPTDLPAWLQQIWTWLRTQDAPTNCLPSLHVASVYLSVFAFRSDGQKKTFWVMLVWGTAIALSTLTTKQHYVADIVSGLGLALFFYWWFHTEQAYERIWPKIKRTEGAASTLEAEANS